MRVADWESRLAAYLASVARKPHRYGSHDCLLFVAGAVKAMTGVDFARGHRGKYRSAATASRYLRKLGFDSPAAMVAAHLPEKPVGFASRGDLVADAAGVPGLCIGGEALFVGIQALRQAQGERGAEGLVRVPRREWSRAWAV